MSALGKRLDRAEATMAAKRSEDRILYVASPEIEARLRSAAAEQGKPMGPLSILLRPGQEEPVMEGPTFAELVASIAERGIRFPPRLS